MKYSVGDNGDTTVYLDKFLMAKKSQEDEVTQSYESLMGKIKPRK